MIQRVVKSTINRSKAKVLMKSRGRLWGRLWGGIGNATDACHKQGQT